MSSLINRREFVYGLSGSIALTMLACRRQKNDFQVAPIPKEFQKYDKSINFYTNYFIKGIPIGLDVSTRNGFPTKINIYDNHSINPRYINKFLQTEIYHLYHKERFFKPRINKIEYDLNSAKDLIFKKMNEYLSQGNRCITILTDNQNSLFYKFINKYFKKIIKFTNDISLDERKDKSTFILNFRSVTSYFDSENFFNFSIYPNTNENNLPLTHFLEQWNELLYNGNLYTQQPIINKINTNSISEIEFIFIFLKSRDSKILNEHIDFFSFYKFLINDFIKDHSQNINFFEVIKAGFILINDSDNFIPNQDIDNLFINHISNPYIEDIEFINEIQKAQEPRFFDEIFSLRSNSKLQSNINNPYQYLENKWGMVIDLNTCNGCGECLISCQIENNIPFVGKDEITKDRDLNWIKIEKVKYQDKFIYFPLMCQHCDNAPCESVCPVNASTHSPEGLNEAIYNRCIGTRYCMANCPYKVRKFNFYQYSDKFNNTFTNAFNPNVSIRERGIAEKCTMCVQRINELKSTYDSKILDSKSIKTACQEICPQKSIKFINFNNLSQADKSLITSDSAFSLLAEFNTQPSIIYIFNK